MLSEEEIDLLQEKLPAQDQLERLSSFYKLMGDPSRLKLLIALLDQELCASDLAAVAGLSRSAASHQLKALKDAKLVRKSKNGQNVTYALDDEHIHHVLEIAFEHILEES